MELTQPLRSRDRLPRTVLAAGLAVYALWSLRNGKRLRGAAAGLGAFALGYGASAESGDRGDSPADGFDTDSSSEAGQLRCAICGEPIVVGQPRVPNENDETVHEACLKSPA